MSVLLAVLLPVLVGMAGLAIDGGNLYINHNRLQAAVDAGALAGSLELPYDPNMNKGIVDAAVEDMLLANYANATIASIAPGDSARSVCVTADASVDTMLLGVLGIGSNTVSAQACAGFNDLEIVFVIDNSGSMKGTPIARVKEAAVDLVELIMPNGADLTSKVGLVGFRGKVRIGADVDGLPEGCRNADGTMNPEDSLHPDYMDDYWALPNWLRGRVVFDTCSDLPTTLALTGIEDKPLILSSVNSMTANGDWSGTVIPEGVKWGREVLTPEAPYDQGSSDERMRKIMILLTDGDTEDGMCGGNYAVGYTPNNYWTNAYFGMGETDCNCEDGGCLNQAMLDEAQQAKDAGVEIFSIRFGNSDGVDRDLMMEVASSSPGTDDHYFDAPSVNDFDEIFKQIGRQLGWRLLN